MYKETLYAGQEFCINGFELKFNGDSVCMSICTHTYTHKHACTHITTPRESKFI